MASPNYEKNDNVKFVNPYNFVRLPKGNPVRKQIGENVGLTGKLHCSLSTRTPLAILDTETVDKEIDDNGNRVHPKYHFFSVDGKKLIPGSTIRGCVRSVYETLTDSCFVTLGEEYLSRRVDAKKAYAPGILMRENGEWRLYSAKRLYVQTKDVKDKNGHITKPYFQETKDLNTEERVITQGNQTFRLGDSVKILNSDQKTGRVARTMIIRMEKVDSNTDCFVYVGEPINRKSYQSVFKKDKCVQYEKTEIVKAMNDLEFVVDMYQNSSINRNLKDTHYGYMGYKRAKESGVIPLWYKVEDGSLSLSMAAIGRMVYKETVNSLVGSQRNPCQKRSDVCPACDLFGMAKGEGMGSRLRFTDAQIVCEGSISEATLKELGTPRTGYYPFYAENGIDYDQPGAMINGRKYYWHIPEANGDSSIYTTNIKNERNATVELLSDAEFEFDVFFNNISAEQLEQLKWALTLGENTKESDYCHKIGHGKPLGLGSVKIQILSEYTREYNSSIGYQVRNTNQVEVNTQEVKFNEDVKEQMLAISSFIRLAGQTVCYPFITNSNNENISGTGKNETASHQWFSQNKSNLHMALNDVRNEDQELPVFTYVTGDANGSKVQSESQKFIKTDIRPCSKREYRAGERFTGKVVGRWQEDKCILVEIPDGSILSIWEAKKRIPVGSQVEVICQGKQEGKRYVSWSIKR